MRLQLPNSLSRSRVGPGRPRGRGCLPGNGEQMAGCVDLDLHGVVLQLQQASPHIHLLLESADKLLPQLSHLGLLTLPAVQLDLGCPEDGGRGNQRRREGQARQIWAYMGPSLIPVFLNHPKDLLDYYFLPHLTSTLSLLGVVHG